MKSSRNFTGILFAASTIVVLGGAAVARAADVVVDTTSTSFNGADGRCDLYEAVTAVMEQITLDTCVYSGSNRIRLRNSGTYSIIEGISLENAILVGNGVGSTFLKTNGFINPVAVYINAGGGLQDLSVQGESLVQATRGVEVGPDGNATLVRVRVFGFNDSGIVNNGILDMSFSTVNNNSAPNGGGGLRMQGFIATIKNSTISTNQARFGGGIAITFGQVALDYCTIANNTASAGHGGGIHVVADASGFAECDGLHTTVAFNTSTQSGAGIFTGPVGTNPGSSAFGTKWNASIIAKNTRSGTADDFVGNMRGDPNLATQDGLNKNLVGVLSNPRPTGWNLKNIGDFAADPQFSGGLASNGGPTKTVALKTTATRSPAIDAGSNQTYDNSRAFTTDQRGAGSGFTAPVRTRFDLGSFEAR